MDIKYLTQGLKYGSTEEKLLVITKIRRRVNEDFLMWLLPKYNLNGLKNEIAKMDSFSPNDINELQKGLKELLEAGKDILHCWYATIALIDIDDLSHENLEILLDSSDQVMKWLIQVGEEGGAVSAAALEFQVQKETVRGISKFKKYSETGEILMKCFNGEILLGRQITGGQKVLCDSSLIAFGALGDPNYREFVEYKARQEKDIKTKKVAEIALSMWGTDFDSIKNKIEKEPPGSGGFLKKLFG